MPRISFNIASPDRPARNEPSYEALVGTGSRIWSRWTGRPCDLVPDGTIFFQRDLKDRELYTQAGCTNIGGIGGTAARRRITTDTDSPIGVTYGTDYREGWCCQQPQVIDVFNAYVQSPEYERKRLIGLAFAGALILGVSYVIINRKKLGLKLEPKRTQTVSWAARNPYDEDDWGTEERDDG